MKKASLVAGMLIVCATAFALKGKHYPSSTASNDKDGYMKVSFGDINSYCGRGTSQRYSYNHDTLELPYCTAFRCSGKVAIEKDPTGQYRCINTIKRIAEDTPFYFRPQVLVEVHLTKAQRKHFDAFKNIVFASVKDTGLRSSIWFELNSIECALKNGDGVSYIIGMQQLTALWARLPDQWYDGK